MPTYSNNPKKTAAPMDTTLSTNILRSANGDAPPMVSDTNTLILSARGFEAFIAQCEAPGEPSEALGRLMALH